MTEAEQNLIDSVRCELFENIAREIWNKICQAHSVNINLGEDGITREIISDIRNFSVHHQSNFDVYANPGFKEPVYGSDMDIFVETTKDNYLWFALQAKLLKSNNRYDTMRDGYSQNHSSYQWDKLKVLEGVSGCEAFFLLYNGVESLTGKISKKKDVCGRTYGAEQLGCSLINLDIAASMGLRRNNSNTQFDNPRFEDFHVKYSEPWRVLVCCYQKIKGKTLYSYAEIVEASSNFIIPDSSFFENDNIGDLSSQKDEEIIENNRIVKACNIAEYSPSYRIIVNRSDRI